MSRASTLTCARETCSIEPSNFHMVRPNGVPLPDEARSTGSKTATDDGDVTTTRMVDLALGLNLDDRESEIVAETFRSMMDNEHSLNQSLAYIRDTPLFLDLELKKAVSNRDPDVQLAIWQAALYAKRLYHGWDTSMPMPGIVVSGYDWQCYVMFERDGGLVRLCSTR